MLKGASIGFPTTSSPQLFGLDLTLNQSSSGGHALLGRNGVGKTLLASALVHEDGKSGWLRGGAIDRRDGWNVRSASVVSFESHEDLLAEGGSVYRALGAPPGATPTKACKFLIVRFGLHPLLYRPVSAISTGEIRKVLLARALATRPSLLVLDNAFDGLDVPSRDALKQLISTTLNGFGQLLVQGVSASDTARTQVLLLTHRAEEIVDEISTVSYAVRGGDGEAGGGAAGGRMAGGGAAVHTESRDGRAARLLMKSSLGVADDGDGDAGGGGEGDGEGEAFHARGGKSSSGRWCPSVGEVTSVWGTAQPSGTALVEAGGLNVRRGRSTLLKQLEWRVQRGEHWLIAGGNGAGKSTLSRLLARVDATKQGASGRLSVLGTRLASEAARSSDVTAAEAAAEAEAAEAEAMEAEATEEAAEEHVAIGAAQHIAMLTNAPKVRPPPPPPPPQREGVGWVSTELHLALARSSTLATDVLCGSSDGGGGSGSRERSSGGGTAGKVGDISSGSSVAAHVARWLGLTHAQLWKPFAALSQGEQKLVLVGAALAKRPALLVLDEPMQGLDAANRARVLLLVERVCSSTDTSLVYITHHYEEVLPCVTHVMHLTGGEAAFCGERAWYEQSSLRSVSGTAPI